ncbi:MAG: hypothetical protein GF365_02295 [Candidatus Buchananbacteria bacterium]|nr:hypothetical protein [Candidatus Buchananbacteria bacterium]
MAHPTVKWNSEKRRFEITIGLGNEVAIIINQQIGITRIWNEEIGSITEEGKWRRKRKPKEK